MSRSWWSMAARALAAVLLLVGIGGGGRAAAAPAAAPAAALAAAAPAPIPRDARGLPLWQIRVWTDFPVRIELPSREALTELLRRVPIAAFDREQVRPVWDTPKSFHLVCEPRVTEAELAALTAAGYVAVRLPDLEREGRQAIEGAWAAQAAKGGAAARAGEKGVYHTHAQIGQILQQIATDHPAIARYYSLGGSVQGRALHALEISGDVGIEQAEPEVRLTSTIHGNEPVQLENLLNLAEYLTANYGTDPVVSDLVDHTDIHIVPCLNPDGLSAGTRGNSSGMDLNRNFPVPDGSIGDDGTYSEQVETALVKNHGAARHFVISEVGHTGALVVNYPWDYTYTLAPDDAALIDLSLEYSTYNAPMYNSSEFPQGITNGAAWYVVHGSLQDWSYQATGCVDLTIEVSNTSIPPASQLDQFWNENRESLLHLIQAARYGVHGRVTAAGTGAPLAATVTVTGNPKPVTTDPAFGDYYKLLPTGTFELTIEAAGYTPRTIAGVATTWGTPTVLDVQLDPLASGDVAGRVRSRAGGGLTADVAVRRYPSGALVTTVQSLGTSGGTYGPVHLDYGSYTFHVTATGFAALAQPVTVDADQRTMDMWLTPIDPATLLADNLEAGAGNWSGAWGLVTSTSHSATHAMADSPVGNYVNNADTPCALASPLDLQGVLEGTLTFWARWNLELNYDCVTLEVSTDGGTVWSPAATNATVAASGQGVQVPAGIPVFEGVQTAWVLNTVSLAPWLGQPSVRLRFRLRTDVSIAADGFYFDDVTVGVLRPQVTGVETPPVAAVGLNCRPNPFNPATTLSFATARAGRVGLAVHDLRGRLVRRLLDAPLPAGEHRVRWDGNDAAGRRLGSGVYVARLRAEGEQPRTVKLVLGK